MGLENLQYVAKGCFLAGTLISTPLGDRKIETLRRGDRVVSFNENTGKHEISKIKEIDVLRRDGYYSINGAVNATGEHPFYTSDGIKKVKELNIGDNLIGKNNEYIEVKSLFKIHEEVVVYNLLDVSPNNNYYANNFLVHNKGCFLAGTPITILNSMNGSHDRVPIEELTGRELLITYNEKEDIEEAMPYEKLDRLVARSYYVINGEIKATAEHPFYTVDGIRKVDELRIGDMLLTRAGKKKVTKLEYIEEDVVIYNIINVEKNHNYYAGRYLVHNKGGGGCFPAGTKITMLTGNKNIEDVKKGDRIWTLNEKTGITQPAIVGDVDVLEMPGYYIINGDVRATEGHPFYTTRGIKKVAELKSGDTLIKNFDVKTPIKSIEYIDEKTTVYNLLSIEPNHNYLADGYLVHNKGSAGGRGGGSSSHSSSGSKSSSSSSSTPSAPKAGTSTAKPGAKVKGADGKEVTSSTKAPSKSQYKNSNGIVGDNGYTPRYNNGYVPPAGSVVYNQDRGFFDYLPWIYLFSQDSPANDSQVIVQPDGKEVEAKPVQEGIDGLAVLNWIVLIALALAVIGGIVWGINKYASRNDPPKRRSYGGYY